MIRKAYFEDPAYVPLVTRAYELWRELEGSAGEELLRMTGVLTVGQEGSEIIEGTQRAARLHNLSIHSLGRDELRKRYPTLKLLPDEVAIFDREAGVLKPERAIAAHLDLAQRAGAEMKFEAAMQGWRATEDGFEILLGDGTRVTAAALVLALGPWFQQILGELGVAIRVQRNVQVWFRPATADYDAARFPPFLLDRAGLPAALYGFPDFGDGVKAAFHGFGDLTDAQHVERDVDETRDIAPLVRPMQEWMPGAAAKMIAAKPCMYSLTPDQHFVVDRHPEHPQLIVCGGFSGHGFKFAPVIGEIAADLALDGGTRHEIGFLSLQRFRNAK
jgi:sarcosine oxidase